MGSTFKPSIIVAGDARPFFGVEFSETAISADEQNTQKKRFAAFCGSTLKAHRERWVEVSLDPAEFDDSLIDASYREGGITVMADALNDTREIPYNITLTHYLPTLDEEDGQVYDEWQTQSTYHVQDGIVVRSDRVPPPEEDIEMVELEHEQFIEQLDQLTAAHIAEIDAVSNQTKAAFDAVKYTNDDGQEALRHQQEAFKFLDIKHRHELQQLIETGKIQHSDDEDLQKLLGVNHQPVASQEFNNLMLFVGKLLRKTEK